MSEDNVPNVFGTIKRVYSDGTAEVLIDGSSETERLANLGGATQGSRCLIATDGTDLFIMSASSCGLGSGGAVDLTAVPVPVGSYWFTEDPRDPHTLWPGTAWQSLSEGRGLINTIDPALLGTLGGSDTLTTAQLPSHTHTQNSHNHTQNAHNHSVQRAPWYFSEKNAGDTVLSSNTSYGLPYGWPSVTSSSTTASNNATTATNQTAGGGAAHQHPYRKVFIWRRLPDTGPVEQLNLTEISEKIDELEYIVSTLDIGELTPALSVYPVGAIYISANPADPSTLFGGTWQSFGQGKTILGAGDGYPNGDTGGSKTVTLTSDQMPEHTHTYNEPKDHKHVFGVQVGTHYLQPTTYNHAGAGTDIWIAALDGNTTSSAGQTINRGTITGGQINGSALASQPGTNTGKSTLISVRNNTSPSGASTSTKATGSSGNGADHDNMPPFIVVNMWVRTA